MDFLCITVSLISLGIIVTVSIILFTQYYNLKKHFEGDLQSIVTQINSANDYNLNYNQVQENNIKNLDNNLNILRDTVGAVATTKNSVAVPGSTMLVKRNADGSVAVCTPDGKNCRAL